jgi:hypothetical protein
MMATMTQTPSATATKPSVGFLAESEPTETYVVSLLPQMAAPEQPSSSSSGRISQTTEHLLIAAGSIGRRTTGIRNGTCTNMSQAQLSSSS